jgi:hypothetical protein
VSGLSGFLLVRMLLNTSCTGRVFLWDAVCSYDLLKCQISCLKIHILDTEILTQKNYGSVCVSLKLLAEQMLLHIYHMRKIFLSVSNCGLSSVLFGWKILYKRNRDKASPEYVSTYASSSYQPLETFSRKFCMKSFLHEDLYVLSMNVYCQMI